MNTIVIKNRTLIIIITTIIILIQIIKIRNKKILFLKKWIQSVVKISQINNNI